MLGVKPARSPLLPGNGPNRCGIIGPLNTNWEDSPCLSEAMTGSL